MIDTLISQNLVQGTGAPTRGAADQQREPEQGRGRAPDRRRRRRCCSAATSSTTPTASSTSASTARRANTAVPVKAENNWWGLRAQRRPDQHRPGDLADDQPAGAGEPGQRRAGRRRHGHHVRRGRLLPVPQRPPVGPEHRRVRVFDVPGPVNDTAPTRRRSRPTSATYHHGDKVDADRGAAATTSASSDVVFYDGPWRSAAPTASRTRSRYTLPTDVTCAAAHADRGRRRTPPARPARRRQPIDDRRRADCAEPSPTPTPDARPEPTPPRRRPSVGGRSTPTAAALAATRRQSDGLARSPHVAPPLGRQVRSTFPRQPRRSARSPRPRSPARCARPGRRRHPVAARRGHRPRRQQRREQPRVVVPRFAAEGLTPRSRAPTVAQPARARRSRQAPAARPASPHGRGLRQRLGHARRQARRQGHRRLAGPPQRDVQVTKRITLARERQAERSPDARFGGNRSCRRQRQTGGSRDAPRVLERRCSRSPRRCSSRRRRRSAPGRPGRVHRDLQYDPSIPTYNERARLAARRREPPARRRAG